MVGTGAADLAYFRWKGKEFWGQVFLLWILLKKSFSKN